MSDDAKPRECKVCKDPAVCARHGLIRPIMTTTDTKTECLIEKDPAAAFLYRALLRLAYEQDVDISYLMMEDL